MTTKERYYFTAQWCKSTGINLEKSFFELDNAEIDKIVFMADYCRYKRPKYCAKSRARAFYDNIKEYGK